jgi:hypothetical protein
MRVIKMARGLMVVVIALSSGNYKVEFSTFNEIQSNEVYSEEDLFRLCDLYDVEVFINEE